MADITAAVMAGVSDAAGGMVDTAVAMAVFMGVDTAVFMAAAMADFTAAVMAAAGDSRSEPAFDFDKAQSNLLRST